jgi:hypothetical protein
MKLPELSQAHMTAGDAFSCWMDALIMQRWPDDTEVDMCEAHAAAIGWASRDQAEIICP